MNQKTRIQKDIKMFEDNLKTTQHKTYTPHQQKIIELATQYYQDAQYYTQKKDYYTAFGCINYAHGLLDALIKY